MNRLLKKYLISPAFINFIYITAFLMHRFRYYFVFREKDKTALQPAKLMYIFYVSSFMNLYVS